MKNKTLISLTILGAAFLGGCHNPQSNVKAKSALPFQKFESCMGDKYSYSEEKLMGYDQHGNPLTLRRYLPENPNNVKNSMSKLRIYLKLRGQGIDLLKLPK